MWSVAPVSDSTSSLSPDRLKSEGFGNVDIAQVRKSSPDPPHTSSSYEDRQTGSARLAATLGAGACDRNSTRQWLSLLEASAVTLDEFSNFSEPVFLSIKWG